MLRRKGDVESTLVAGRVFGSYQIVGLVGEGGMGVVFRAVRLGDEQEVALKVLRSELARDEVFRQRFQHEVRAATSITHPNVVPIVEAGEAEGRPYVASRFVPGGTVDDRIRSSGALPVESVVRITGHVASGLDALHRLGVLHRDIKPSNVMLEADGTALLTDFGLAKGRADTVLTRPGQVMGTLDYLAPELIRGQGASPVTDIYALGCLVHECLAGEPPFASVSPLQVGVHHLEVPPPDLNEVRSDLPPRFGWAVARALEKEPDKRPQTAVAYARMLFAAAKSQSK